MGRKAYLEDLATAKTLDIINISHIRSGEDGELTFDFHFSNDAEPVQITATVLDPSDYPTSHDYMLFAADYATPLVSQAVQELPSFSRKSIAHLLTTLSVNMTNILRRLDPTHEIGHGAAPNTPQSMESDDEMEDQSEDNIDYKDDDPDFDLDEDADNEDWLVDDDSDSNNFRLPRQVTTYVGQPVSPQRIRGDLVTAKNAGFKVGAFGSFQASNSCYLCVSCRISKLGISEEAMQAWSVEPSEYLVLLIHYPSGYRDMQFLHDRDHTTVNQHVEFRTGICSSYKPGSVEQARCFFKGKDKNTTELQGGSTSSPSVTLRETFISGPLNALFKERFPSMLRYRLQQGLSWAGAERFYIESMGKHAKDSSDVSEEHLKPDEPRAGLPPIVVADELDEGQDANDMTLSTLSLPLIAMQFLLRHFVRCTDFCQICHCRIDASLEVIKPYVCENPLCLFQYLSLGFGPKIEQEILTQPLVVDLLVGFCYSAAISKRIRELPSLDWRVPNPRLPVYGMATPTDLTMHRISGTKVPDDITTAASDGSTTIFKARYSEVESHVLFEDEGKCPVRTGDWIVINIPTRKTTAHHCRVVDTTYFPTVGLSKPIILASKTSENADQRKTPIQGKENKKENAESEQTAHNSIDTKWQTVSLHAYNNSFQSLSNEDKMTSIVLLCDLLPKITTMRDYLLARPGVTLASWQDRIPPAALGLLRWIIASNRSAIISVDELPVKPETSDVQLGVNKAEQRITDMPTWLQFRFAMGSPDKENRFVKCLYHGSKDYPTLFAWHGSPIANWHSIIREGLDYKETSHGRAYGNGCYHARDWNTSMGYSGISYIGPSRTWSQSIIHVDQAIALSEIVNAPDKYTSNNPYYVVQHVDWIQTRYLFARLASPTKLTVANDTAIKNVLPQDPQRVTFGPNAKKVELPVTAIAKSRRPKTSTTPTGTPPSSPRFKSDAGPSRKKAKLNEKTLTAKVDDSLGTITNPIDIDTTSVATLDEDRDLLMDDDHEAEPNRPDVEPCTNFSPCPLTNVPAMPPPSYATPNATKTLQKAFQTLLDVQADHADRHRLAELGWYADPAHMETTENLYQWMVELHSFPLDLPLAQDMEAAEISSIVLEIRFGASFPFSPPFIRVVRPRFLSFQSGGGGHVTAGGSICMDLLTSSGWTAVASIESVLLQIRMAMMSCDPRPARLQGMPSDHGESNGKGKGKGKGKASMMGGNGGGEYSVPEAVEAFVRACRVHGWTVPEDLKGMT